MLLRRARRERRRPPDDGAGGSVVPLELADGAEMAAATTSPSPASPTTAAAAAVAPSPAAAHEADAGAVVVRGVRPGGWGPAGLPPTPPNPPPTPSTPSTPPSTLPAPDVTVGDLFPDGPGVPGDGTRPRTALPPTTAAPATTPPSPAAAAPSLLPLLDAARLAATSSLDAYDVLERLAHLALRSLRADRCNVFRFDDSCTRLDLLLSIGRVADLTLGRWYAHGETIETGDVALDWSDLLGQQAFAVPDAGRSPIVPEAIETAARARSCILMPLAVGSSPLGILTVDWMEEREVDGRELAAVEGIGGWATLALGQAIRHDEQRRRLHRAEVRRQLALVVDGTLTLDAGLAQLTRVIQPDTGIGVVGLLATNADVRAVVGAAAPDRRALHVLRSWRAVLPKGRTPLRTRAAADAGTRLVPVVHRNRVIGALVVTADDRRPRPPDEATLVALGLACGEAIHEAGLAHARADADRERLLVEERERLARDLHDSVAQTLTGIGMRLSACRDEVPDHVWGFRLDELMLLTGRASHEVRQAIAGLLFQPRGHDLTHTLRQLVAELRATSGIDAHFAAEGDAGVHLGGAAEHALFRMAHEALANAGRHSGGTRVDVTLTVGADDVVLAVRDDGDGLGGADPFAKEGHFGLLGIRGRVEDLGGELRVGDAEPRGVLVEARVPVRRRRTKEGQ